LYHQEIEPRVKLESTLKHNQILEEKMPGVKVLKRDEFQEQRAQKVFALSQIEKALILFLI